MATRWNTTNAGPALAFSNNTLTATQTAGVTLWQSVPVTGPGLSTGKAYWRAQISGASGADLAIGVAAVSLSLTSAGSFVLGQDTTLDSASYFTGPGNTGAAFYNNGNPNSSPLPTANSGDYLVFAYDFGAGNMWATSQTSVGTLNTNWNGTSANPSTGTGALSCPIASLPAVPGGSIFTPSATLTIDTASTISHSTLNGFLPYDSHFLTLILTSGSFTHTSFSVG